jgi:DNA-binding transcriptional regulator YiaG
MRTIDAVQALAGRGLSLLRAKRAVEAAIAQGEAVVEVPVVEDMMAMAGDLRRAGMSATRLATDPVDVRAIRAALGLSQAQFALRFNLDLSTVQNWEQGRNTPDRASSCCLRVIEREPRAAAAAQETP